MARKRYEWFRFYTEAMSDQRLRRLKPEYRWLFVACLSAARQSPAAGELRLSVSLAYSLSDLSDYAGMPHQAVKAGMAELCRTGLVEWNESEALWSVPGWSARQYESDDVTQRTRRHRAKERSNDVPGNVQSPFVGTPPETETDTDTEVGGNRLVGAPRATRLEPATRTRILRDTANAIATMRGIRDSGRGGAYIAAAVKGITEDIHDEVHDLLCEHPEWDASQLAQQIEHPPRPSAFPAHWKNTLSGTVREDGYV